MVYLYFPSPITIIPFIDEDTAGKMVGFIGDMLNKLAKAAYA
jgi:hypothetical protein